jgi:predicted CoA-substrate-specific enzyme activase
MSAPGRTIGFDIGSRSIKMVVWEDESVADRVLTPTTFSPIQEIEHLLQDVTADTIVVTGHCRDLWKKNPELPEADILGTLNANVLGARHVESRTRRILDIGGLNTMIISLTAAGEVQNYELRTRCAAGTGKYLEVLAMSMQVPWEDFGEFALQADKRIKIDSQCTVFAESEAMFLVADGEKPTNIAMALHMSIVEKTVEVLRRVGGSSPLLLIGGVAHNPCVKQLLDEHLQEEVVVPDDPDFVGALGAALHGATVQS